MRRLYYRFCCLLLLAWACACPSQLSALVSKGETDARRDAQLVTEDIARKKIRTVPSGRFTFTLPGPLPDFGAKESNFALAPESIFFGSKQEKGKSVSGTKPSAGRRNAEQNNLTKCFITVFSDPQLESFAALAIRISYEQFGISAATINGIIDTLSANHQESLEVMSEKIRLNIANTDFERRFKEYNVGSGRFTRKLRPTKRFIEGPIVADIGCGSGGFSEEMARSIPGIRKIISTDIETYHRIANQVIEFRQQSSVDQLPIESDSVDTVVLMDVLHHVGEESQERLIKDIRRVLKPGGKVVVWEDTYSNSLQSTGGDELSGKLLEKFLQLSDQQKKDVLSFNDVLINALFRNLGMPFPFSYKSIEEWEKRFNTLGFSVRHRQFLGIPRGSFYFATRGVLVLEKTSTLGSEPVKIQEAELFGSAA